MKGLLSLLGVLTMAGGASAVVVGCETNNQQNNKEPRQVLNELIGEANITLENNKGVNPMGEQSLKQIVEDAQLLFEMNDPEVINEFIPWFEEAISQFNQSIELPVKLKLKIDEAQSLLDKGNKEENEIIQRMKTAIAFGNMVIERHVDKENWVLNAIEKLEGLISEYNSPTAEPLK